MPTLERKDADALARQQIAAWRNLSKNAAKAESVLNRFAGKVFNCKFSEALEEATEKCVYCCHRNYNSAPAIVVRCNTEVECIKIPTQYNHYNTEAVPDREKYIGLVLTSPEGNKRPRIDAAATIEALEAYREKLRREIKGMIQARESMDEYEKKLEEARNQLETVVGTIYGENPASSEIRKIYDNKYKVEKATY